MPTDWSGPPPLDPTLRRELEEVVGGAHVLSEPDLVAGYGTDWTGRFAGFPAAVLRPGGTAEVAGVLECCRRHASPLVLQGGNTGLSGGAVPLHGEVVMSLRRLTRLEVDEPVGQATVGAGVVVSDLQQAADAAGWAYGVDLGSRGSATVGGTVATNAGGIRMLRYGDTRAQLLGVTAVFGSGLVVSHLSGLLKDNTGYHLPSLLCGSEGTLGVVTEARVRLVARSPERVVALLGFDTATDAVAAAQALRRSLRALSAAELFFGRGMELVRSHFSLPDPLDRPCAAYLLVEASDDADPTTELADAVGSLGGVAAAAVATGRARGAELWRYREGHTEAINARGAPHKLDVSVPLGSVGELVERAPAAVAAVAPAAEVWLFGHAADGNVHVNVTGVDPGDESVDGAVFELAASLGGSVSAEHGIGTAKRRWLSLSRSAEEIAAFAAIKRALDPDALLNPGVLLPPA